MCLLFIKKLHVHLEFKAITFKAKTLECCLFRGKSGYLKYMYIIICLPNSDLNNTVQSKTYDCKLNLGKHLNLVSLCTYVILKCLA